MSTVTTEEDDYVSEAGSDQTSSSLRETGLPWFHHPTVRGNRGRQDLPVRAGSPFFPDMILCEQCDSYHTAEYVHAEAAAASGLSARPGSDSGSDSSHTISDASLQGMRGEQIDRVFNWVWVMNFMQRAGYPPPRYLTNFSEFHNDPRALEYLRLLVEGRIFNGPRLEHLPPVMVGMIIRYLRDSAGQSWALEMSEAGQGRYDDFSSIPDSVPELGQVPSDHSGDDTRLDSDEETAVDALEVASEDSELGRLLMAAVDGTLDLVLPERDLRQELEDELAGVMFRFENDF